MSRAQPVVLNFITDTLSLPGPCAHLLTSLNLPITILAPSPDASHEHQQIYVDLTGPQSLTINQLKELLCKESQP
jgi:hypothetical protein